MRYISLHWAILLLGPTAAGKTPLGDMISFRGIGGLGCVHFDFGSELRNIAFPGAGISAFTKDELNFVRGVLNDGLLRENEQFYIARKIFYTFIERERIKKADIIILNGLPRHIGQAEQMTGIVNVGTVIELSCSESDILCRIEKNTGEDRAERSDDNHDLVMKKIGLYRKRTASLMEFYRNRGADIFRIEVTHLSDPNSVYDEFLKQYHAEQTGIR